AGIVGGMAMGEMAAGGQIQTHEGVARRKQGIEDFLIGVGARMGLHIGVGRAEQLAGAVDGDLLDDIDIFAAAVIALAGIALGILVGQDRALRFQHRLGNDVLGRDQLDLVALAVQLVLNRIEDVGIGGFQPLGEKAGMGRDG